MSTVINGTTGVSQIQDGTVTSAKIVDGNVTQVDLEVGLQGVSIGPVTVSAGALLTLAHTLGTTPSDWKLQLRCKTAEFGYSVGDVISMPEGGDMYSVNSGCSVMVDASNVYIRVATSAFGIVHKTSFTCASITAANWEIIGKVWK